MHYVLHITIGLGLSLCLAVTGRSMLQYKSITTVDMYSTNSNDTPKNFCGIYTGQFCIRGVYLMVNKFKIKVDRSADVLYNIFILSNKGFNFINTFSPGGGIGRHKGLKIPRWKQHDGSSPSPGTIQQQQYNDSIAQQDRATAF